MTQHLPFEDWLLWPEDLPPDQAQALHEHLESCLVCRGLAERWRAADSRLANAPMLAPRPGFLQRWQAQETARQVAERRWQAWLFLALAGSGSLILAATIGWQSLATISPTHLLVSLLETGVTLGSQIGALGEIAQVLRHGLQAFFPPALWLAMLVGLAALSLLWLISISRLAVQGVRQ